MRGGRDSSEELSARAKNKCCRSRTAFFRVFFVDRRRRVTVGGRRFFFCLPLSLSLFLPTQQHRFFLFFCFHEREPQPFSLSFLQQPWCVGWVCSRLPASCRGRTSREGVVENDRFCLFLRRSFVVAFQSCNRIGPPPLTLLRSLHTLSQLHSAGSSRPGDSGGRPLLQARAGRRRRHR